MLVIAWGFRAFLQGRLFPPQRERAVPWNGWQLLVLVILIQLFWPAATYWALHETGLLPVLSGVDGDVGMEEQSAASSIHRARESLWAFAAMFPLQIATIVGLLAVTSRTRPADLGLTTERFGHNVLLGALGWMLLTPPVFILNLIINLLYRRLLDLTDEEHPLMRLLRVEPRAAETVLIVLTAVVAAPVLEELLFRGVLQPWFAGRRGRGLIALGAAIALALSQRWTKMQAAWADDGWLGMLEEGAAIGFVVVLIPGYFMIRQLAGALAPPEIPSPMSLTPPTGYEDGIQTELPPQTAITAALPPETSLAPRLSRRERAMNNAGAIYATAVLFAAAHSSIWPTPISLFVLALGLGYVVYRTQSIVGSITLHALFNGLSCVVLLLAPQSANGNEATSAMPAAPSAVKSTTVPGS